MKEFDVITIGAATQDTYVSSPEFHVSRNSKVRTGKVESFEFGVKIPIENFHIETGGGATNAAATLKRLGCTVSVLSRCGDDPSGDFVIRELQKEGIDTSHIQIVPNGKTTYSIVFLAKNGERTILVYRGLSEKFSSLQKTIARVPAKWMYVSSLGGDIQTLSVIARRAATGTSFAWNPGVNEIKLGAKKLSKIVKSVSVLLLNWEEACQFFSCKTESAIRNACQHFQIPVTVITKGDAGSVAFIGKKIFRVRIRKVRAVDTTGAGDSFGSGFLASLLTHPGDFKRALYVASANGMSNVLVPGAKHGLITLKTINRFRSRVRVSEL